MPQKDFCNTIGPEPNNANRGLHVGFRAEIGPISLHP
jgi:hypothetical protein